MELILQATEVGHSGIALGVSLASLVVVFLGLLFLVATHGDSLSATIFLLFIGLMGALFGTLTHSQTEEQAYENFALMAAEQLNIENPTPLGDEEKIGMCHVGGGRAVSEYSWINEDGDLVRGLIMRSPEQNGECVFTLSATS